MAETAEQIEEQRDAAQDQGGWPIPSAEVMRAIRRSSPLDAWRQVREPAGD